MTLYRGPHWLGRTLAGMLALLGLSLAFAAAARAEPLEGIHKIRHVVMIMQENRSFDTYFGTYPGANGIPARQCVPDPMSGGCIRPFHNSSITNFGGPHGTDSSINDIDGGKMDGFVGTAEQGRHCTGTNPSCTPCNPQREAGRCVDVMGYHDAREIPNYWDYAKNFVLQDNMFESAASWSLPEHLFMVSGWSAACPHGDLNPMDCTGTLNAIVPSHFWGSPIEPSRATYAWTDITYLLAKHNVSWHYYVFTGDEPDCSVDEAVTCQPVQQDAKTPGIWNPLPSFTDVNQNDQRGNVKPFLDFYREVHDESTCELPNVSWLDPNLVVGEHPPSSVARGQAYVTTVVNAIMRSPCWKSTAIFISWDDWGGFYDHVVPPTIDEAGFGLRVPGLVISPYAKAGFIDHQLLSHDSYLKFIEDDFLSGARLNPATDGRPDRRPDVREEAPGAGDLANDFDFAQTPRTPLLLAANPEPGPASEPPGGIPNPPSVYTGGAGRVERDSAMLRGSVNPNEGLVGDCRFEYGSSSSYGSSVLCSPPPGSGEEAVAVAATVEGLSASTEYHFRIVASNNGGTSFGADRQFTTDTTRLASTTASLFEEPLKG
jgi:phospholipase C